MMNLKDLRNIRNWTKLSSRVKGVAIALMVFIAMIPASHAVVDDATFFGYLNLDYPGMSTIKSAVNAGNYTLAKSELLRYYQNRPSNSSNGRAFFPLQTTGIIPLNEAWLPNADENVNHTFEFAHFRKFVGTDIDWNTNEANLTSWSMYLWRHDWWPNYGCQYARTQNEKYAQAWIYEFKDWTNDMLNSTPDYNYGNGAQRAVSWVRSAQYFVHKYPTPSLTPDDYTFFMKSLKEQSDQLFFYDWISNYWALIHVAIMYPEFKSSDNWLTTSVAHLDEMIKNDNVYPDGVTIMIAPDYQDAYIERFFSPYLLAKINNLNLFPADYPGSIENMINFQIFINKPSGISPAIGDSFSHVKYGEWILGGADVFNRDDFRYVATAGASGTPPAEISKEFSDSKYYVMRSQWGNSSNFNQSLYLVAKFGPFDYDHSHFDWNGIEAYAYGKDLISDPGVHSYSTALVDGVNWHKYYRITRAHNTVVIDDKSQMRYALNTDGTPRFELPPGPGDYETKSWVTNNGFDFVSGWFSANHALYNVDHERKIFFVRNEYWIISDLLTGSGSHTYDQYFHLPDECWGNTELNNITRTASCTWNNLQIVPADPSDINATLFDDWMEQDYYFQKQSPTIKYRKSGTVPASFDTVIYPSSTTPPALTLSRMSVARNGQPLTSNTASGLKIDIGSNTDYYLVAHDNSTAQTDYGQFQFTGNIAYLRKNSTGVIKNIQINEGTELKENGTNLATTYGVKAHISSSNNVIEINAPAPASPEVTNFNIWCPNAVSVKINGISVGFSQNDDYVVPGTFTSVSTPTFSPLPAIYTSRQTVSISTLTNGATIHYSVDGTTITEASPTYSTPITVSSTKTIKAGAWKTGMNPSSIASSTYTITPPTVVLLAVFVGGTDKCENVGAKVQFNGTSSYDPDGTIISYDWEFGDGATGTGAAPNHTYASYRWNGSAYQPFIVNLTVMDNSSLTNKTSQNVTIWKAGDANGDGKVNILDAFVVGLKWNGNDPCADLNNDGKVNILDASIIGLKGFLTYSII